MQNSPLVEQAQRAIRSTICIKCWRRPPGSEAQGPFVSRSCEPVCSIFKYLPQLLGIATHQKPGCMCYEDAVKNALCSKCDLTPTAGDFCSEQMTRSCPLSRYSGEVLFVLERVVEEAKRTHAPTDETTVKAPAK